MNLLYNKQQLSFSENPAAYAVGVDEVVAVAGGGHIVGYLVGLGIVNRLKPSTIDSVDTRMSVSAL